MTRASIRKEASLGDGVSVPATSLLTIPGLVP